MTTLVTASLGHQSGRLAFPLKTYPLFPMPLFGEDRSSSSLQPGSFSSREISQRLLKGDPSVFRVISSIKVKMWAGTPAGDCTAGAKTRANKQTRNLKSVSRKVLSLAEACKANTATLSYDSFYRDVNEVDFSRCGTWASSSDSWKASSQNSLLLHHPGKESYETC